MKTQAPKLLNKVLIILASLLGACHAYCQPTMNELVMWLKADAGIVTDGSGYVAFWADSSGAGHHAAQATASRRPLFVNSSTFGGPAVRFGSGGNHYLTVVGQVLTSRQFTIFAVVNETAASSWHREIISNWHPANGYKSVFFGLTGNNPVRARFTDFLLITGAGVVANPAKHFIFTAVSGASNALIYQNRALIASTNGPLPGDMVLTSSYFIGRQGSFDGEFWRGDIAEILVYNAELTQAQKMEVWSYLEAKYRMSAVISIFPAVEIGWASRSDVTYQVQWSSELNSNVWYNLGLPLQGNGSNIFIFDSTRDQYKKFYRVLILP